MAGKRYKANKNEILQCNGMLHLILAQLEFYSWPPMESAYRLQDISINLMFREPNLEITCVLHWNVVDIFHPTHT